MTRRGIALLVVVSCLWSTNPDKSARGQSADEVIAAYVEALGGETAISAIETLTVKGKSFSAKQPDVPASEFVREFKDDKYLETLTRNKRTGKRSWQNGYDGKTLWSKEVGRRELDAEIPLTPASIEIDLELSGHPKLALLLAEYPTSVEVISQETINDRPTSQLKFTDADGGETLRYFDTETGLLLMSARQQGSSTRPRRVEQHFEYREQDEIQFVSKLIVKINGTHHTTYEYTEVIVDKEMPDSQFSAPEKDLP